MSDIFQPSLFILLDHHGSTAIQGITALLSFATALPPFNILLSKNGERRGKRQTEEGGSASDKLCDTVTDTFTVKQDKHVGARERATVTAGDRTK